MTTNKLSTAIPFVKLSDENNSIKKSFLNELSDAIDHSQFVQGSQITNLEKIFAQTLGSPYAVTCGSGLDAIEIALRSLHLPKNSEVILPAHTFIATLIATIRSELKPVLVDVDPTSGNIDFDEISKKWTSKTRVLLPVHLYGQPAPMRPILNFAKQHHLFVVEDAAQAHCARSLNQFVGTLGTLGCFSFYPAKNLGAFGQAGAILTQDEELKDRCCAIREIGMTQKNQHDEFGMNSRMDPIQAIALKLKLPGLLLNNEKRKKVAQQYLSRLREIEQIKLPFPSSNNDHVYHLFVIQLESSALRDQFIQFLSEDQIQTGIHYPIPMYLQKSMKHLGYRKGDFPNTEKFSFQSVSLPFYPSMRPDEIDRVCSRISEFFKYH